MRRVTVVLVACAVLVALMLVGVAGAQAPTAYYTSISLVNTSDTEDANVVILFYNQDGSGPPDPDYSMAFSIGPGKSKTIINNLNSDLSADILAPPPAIRGATSWVGNAVVYSDKEVLSIANEAASVGSPYGSAAYNGLSEGDLSPQYYAPLIANIGQPDTTINIQNPSSAPVSVTVEYVKDVYGVDHTAAPVVVPANGSAIWPVPTGALDGTGRFLGSAKVTADGDVGLVVDAIFSSSSPISQRYNARQSYTGFSGGAAKVVAPLIQKNDNGVWYTGLSVMNLGPGSATVRVTYSGTEGTGTDTSCIPNTPVSGLTEADFSLDENGSKVIITEFGGALDSVALAGVDCFRGAAIVEVVGGTGKLVAVVSVAGQNRADVAYYRGFDVDTASDTVKVPLILKYLGVAGANGWCTGIQIANTDTISTTVTGTFDVTCGGTPETVVDSVEVGPDSSQTFLQANGYAVGSLGTRQNCIGSATFTASGGSPIVGTANQTWFGTGNPFTGDVLLISETFNR